MTRDALRRLSAHYQLHIVADGQEAMDFLYRKGRFAGAPLPDLVLLDLNLPKLSGHEVLFKIKSSGRLKHIPVVVLTSSSAPSDVHRSYQRNADCFVTKAAGLEAYAREIKVVEALLPH
jgi:two-component system response regulator